ncbi:MAG: heavy metal translocating P-type ATPase [Oscillospiraceae bacterium]|nr:heavy metal translocating P-type ATPase [Oscillospiraceae bacterium]
MTPKQKRLLVRIVCALALLIATALGGSHLPGGTPVRLLAYLIPYAIVGWEIIWKAVRNLTHGQLLDENFLMSIATFGAFATGEFAEAVAVMVFYQVGELFQDVAVDRSRRSITALMDICPEYANLEQDGALVQTDPDAVAIGTIIVIRPGERVPLDGVVVDGTSALDTAALTGEAMPQGVQVGDEVISGCVNGSGTLRVRTTKEFEDSTVSKILELVESATEKKAKTENFITRFARVYTPLVVLGAVLLAVIPSLVTGDWGKWIHQACVFLVISCPCALVISVPLGFFSGIGAASRQGVLIKGSNYLEALAQMQVMVCDKTGTLTTGKFTVTGCAPVGLTEQELLELAALAEGYSNHPIASSIREAYAGALDLARVTDYHEQSGTGVSADIDGHPVLAGNKRLLTGAGVAVPDIPGTAVFLARDGAYCGCVQLADEAKPGAAEALAALRGVGVANIVMLTGDRRAAATETALALGIDDVRAELLPGDKVESVEQLLREMHGSGKLAFVGDGINDAPVLGRADIGIAMGAMGSDAAIEAADVVLMHDDLRKIAETVRIARKTLLVVRQNIAFALAIKAIVLVLGAAGIASMWLAVFADVGVCVLAILNAMRAR